jgi:hypothetical protein
MTDLYTPEEAEHVAALTKAITAAADKPLTKPQVLAKAVR